MISPRLLRRKNSKCNTQQKTSWQYSGHFEEKHEAQTRMRMRKRISLERNLTQSCKVSYLVAKKSQKLILNRRNR